MMFYGALANMQYTLGYFLSGHVIVVLLFEFPILVLLSHCVAPSLGSIHHRSESQTAARVSPSDNSTGIMSQQIPNTQMAVVVHGKGNFLGGVYCFNVAKPILE